MIIKSYLVFPAAGQQAACRAALEALPGCQVEPAANRDLLVLVTESADEAAEKALETQLHAIPSIEGLTLVSAMHE